MREGLTTTWLITIARNGDWFLKQSVSKDSNVSSNERSSYCKTADLNCILFFPFSSSVFSQPINQSFNQSINQSTKAVPKKKPTKKERGTQKKRRGER